MIDQENKTEETSYLHPRQCSGLCKQSPKYFSGRTTQFRKCLQIFYLPTCFSQSCKMDKTGVIVLAFQMMGPWLRRSALPGVREPMKNREWERSRGEVRFISFCCAKEIITKMQGFKMTTVSLVHGLLFWASSAGSLLDSSQAPLSPGRVAVAWWAEMFTHMSESWRAIGQELADCWLRLFASCRLVIPSSHCCFHRGCKDGKIRSYENFKNIYLCGCNRT